jgi:protein SCO1/2
VNRGAILLVLLVLLALLPPAARAAVPTPAFTPALGTRIETGLTMTDDRGRTAPLATFLGGKPAFLLFGYDRCPGLCGVAQASLAEALAQTGLGGDRYSVIFASIDPREMPADARAARQKLAEALPSADLSAWHFLTGPPDSIGALDRAAGLTVSALPGRDLYVHPVATLVLTPDGRISRAFGGLDYAARDLRLALVEASAGRLGTLADRLTVLCSSFDPATGRYSGAVMLGLRIAGLATLGLMGVALLVLRRREASR